MLFFRSFFYIHLVFSLALAHSQARASEKQASQKIQKQVSKKKTDLHWSRLVTITRQLDAIDREAWWVLTQKRPPLTFSIFGKVQRAVQSEEGQKLTQKTLFSCDKYALTRKILNPLGFPQKISVFHSCRKDQELIAEIDWKQKEKIEFTFLPGPLNDILGLNASILGKKIECEVVVDDQAIVQSFSCKNGIKDRSATEVIELEKYEFKKKDNSQLTLKGQVTEEMRVKRKIETTVPLEGKIVVTETEILPPPGYRRKLPGVKPPTPPPSGSSKPVTEGAAATDSSASGLAPVNPDQLVKQIQPAPPLETAPPLAEPEYIEDTSPPSQPIEKSQR